MKDNNNILAISQDEIDDFIKQKIEKSGYDVSDRFSTTYIWGSHPDEGSILAGNPFEIQILLSGKRKFIPTKEVREGYYYVRSATEPDVILIGRVHTHPKAKGVLMLDLGGTFGTVEDYEGKILSRVPDYEE